MAQTVSNKHHVNWFWEETEKNGYKSNTTYTGHQQVAVYSSRHAISILLMHFGGKRPFSLGAIFFTLCQITHVSARHVLNTSFCLSFPVPPILGTISRKRLFCFVQKWAGNSFVWFCAFSFHRLFVWHFRILRKINLILHNCTSCY